MYCSGCGAELALGSVVCKQCGKPLGGMAPGAPGAGPQKAKNSRTVWIVLGCIMVPVVIAIAGIVAAIFVPNFLDALQKARQHRAVAELQRMCTVLEAYKAEAGTVPVATDMAGLAAALGTNGVAIARLDPWKRPYRYACWQESPTAIGCNHYRIATAARDGKFEHADLKDYEPAQFPSEQFDRDIVFGDGGPIQMPGIRLTSP
jgi:type II secretory pathway pseudopilin PulG